jgi:ATP-dependent DNA ligase
VIPRVQFRLRISAISVAITAAATPRCVRASALRLLSLTRALSGAEPAPFPAFIPSALATLRTKVPAGAGYVHEAKLDGYRLQAHLRDGRATPIRGRVTPAAQAERSAASRRPILA